ncbi:50S ribosomal protein L15e [Candidatus Woesearchaeota archaeon]|nr:MAG: 50S ribosomal protein L15e [Candidatus Woesearchaeota archaeon ex4484_78]RLE46361.1 MAG: 50S ribosomal protein L15e [Candidatus Woesearchaeota archaeon]
MGFYQRLAELWKQPKKNLGEIWRQRLIKIRREPVTVRLEHPTRPDRARALGYKAKQGFIVVRQRVKRGPHKRPKKKKGRRSKTQTRRLTLRKNYQLIAEERANKKFPNCEVLNSYYLAEDGKHYWFEVILVDRAHPAVLKDKRISFISKQRGRVYRGKTSTGRKIRGLRHKGKGVEKARPSRRARKRLL